MNNNILQMVKTAKDPQSFLMNIIRQQYGNNPIMRTVMNMANGHNTQGIESLARNICAEKGINADELFKQLGK